MYVKELIHILKQYEPDDEVKVSALVSLSSFDEENMERGYSIINASVKDFDGDDYPTIMAQDENFVEKYFEE